MKRDSELVDEEVVALLDAAAAASLLSQEGSAEGSGS
jgi:hypothetical protein